MTVIDDLARDVGASTPTIRRAVELGLIKGSRPSPRKIEIPVAEQVYVQRTWKLLSELRRHLRTEKAVRVAVIYGSVARGTSGEHSDIDLAVLMDDSSVATRLQVQARLSEKLGRRVQLTDLLDARRSDALWKNILIDGRPVIQRGGTDWRRVKARRR